MSNICIKIGGSTVDSDGLLSELGQSLRNCIDLNHFPVIIHGGGKDIAKNLEKLNKEFTFVEGHRVTDKETLQTVQMVLSGDVNKRIVNALLSCNVPAIGISGVDGNLFEAEKLIIKEQDIGFVGTISNVNTEIIDLFNNSKTVPVISPVSRSKSGQIFNVNADLAAGELAVAIKADHLIFISDVAGVTIDNQIKHEIRTADIEDLISQGHITGGMVPKLRSAKEAVSRGVGKVHICGWYGSETLIKELDVQTSQGTVVY